MEGFILSLEQSIQSAIDKISEMFDKYLSIEIGLTGYTDYCTPKDLTRFHAFTNDVDQIK